SMGAGLLVALTAAPAPTADSAAKRTPREALQALNDLIGPWRGTGMPEGTQQEKQKGFWVEKLAWQWQFKGDDAWLEGAFDKGKYFDPGELRHLLDKNLFRLPLPTTHQDKLPLEGPLADGRLTLERADDKKKETQRLVFTFLHANRFLYRYEVKAADRPEFTRLYQVGATKEDVAFAGAANNQPECVVSGGLGTIPGTHQGPTEYFCCTRRPDALQDHPQHEPP